MWCLPPLLVVAFVWLVMGGSAWAFHIPISFDGDALFYLVQARTTLDHGWWWFNPSIGAPLGLHALPFAQNTNVDQAIVWLVGRFTREIGPAINTAWLVMLALSAVTSTWGLRRLGASRLASGACGVLFALSPFAFYRNIAHLNMVTYLVPFPLTAAVLIADSDRDRPWTPRDLAAPIVGCALLGFNYIYFAFFGGFVLLIGTIAGAVRTRTRAPLAAGSLCLGALVLTTALNLAPNLVAWRIYGRPIGVEHAAVESEIYGLKIRHLLGPVGSHWFPPFQRWLERDDIARFPNENENYSARLGVLGALGFLGLMGLLVLPVADAVPRRLQAVAVVTAGLLLLGTVGGFGTIVSVLISPEIRAYNRLSAFIAFLALVAVAAAMDRLTRQKPAWLRASAFAALVAIGAADQSPALADVARGQLRVRESVGETQAFWAPIEAQLPSQALVFQLPVRPYPLDAGIEHMKVYAHFQPYLVTQRLRWSYPVLTVDQREWERTITRVTDEELPRQLAQAGFSAIAVNKAGYADEGQQLLADLRKGGATPLAENWLYTVFDLRPLGGPR
jgi:phosphoglycerol transferase